MDEHRRGREVHCLLEAAGFTQMERKVHPRHRHEVVFTHQTSGLMPRVFKLWVQLVSWQIALRRSFGFEFKGPVCKVCTSIYPVLHF